MIYKRVEYIEEAEQNAKFPLRQIEVLDPVDGGHKRFIGHITLGLQTPVGVQQMPISFEIAAESIKDAFQKFDSRAEPEIEAARREIEDEIRRIRQESTSRIVTPDQVGGIGAVPGAGKIFNLKK